MLKLGGAKRAESESTWLNLAYQYGNHIRKYVGPLAPILFGP